MKNKLNLPPFYIGQKVVYITGLNMPKNSIHVVRNMIKQTCGCWTLVIDVKAPTEGIHHACMCADCGGYFTSNTTFLAWNPNSFRAIQEAKPPILTFKQIQKVEEEEVLILN